MLAAEIVRSEGSVSGKAVGLLIFALPAILCLWRASRRQAPSRRAAWLAAFCGLLLLIPLGIDPPDRAALPVGLLRALISITGIVCVGRAFLFRRRDQGVGIVGPLVGALFCLLHGLLALSMLTPPSAATAVEGQPWVYRSEEEAIELTLPSEYWVETKESEAVAAFRCRTLSVKTAVFIQKESRRDFAKRVKFYKETDLENLRAGASDSGTTKAGQDYFMASGFEKQPTYELLVHVAHLYRAEKEQTVSLLTEARLPGRSEAARAEQEAAVREAARAIALSVR